MHIMKIENKKVNNSINITNKIKNIKNMFKRNLNKGLLLVTLLFVFIFNMSLSNIAYATDEGDKITYTIKSGSNVSYDIIGTYQAGRWVVTSRNSIMANGQQTSSSSLIGAVCEAYAKVTGSEGTKNILPTLLELVAAGDGSSNWNVEVKSTKVNPDAGYNVIIKTSNDASKFTWGKYVRGTATVQSYKDILNGGNTGMTFEEDVEGLIIRNPLMYNGSGDLPTSMLLINEQTAGIYLSDEKMFNILQSGVSSLPSFITKVSTPAGTAPVAASESYTATVEKDGQKIYIKVRNSSNELVANFYFGDLIGTNQYRERKINNASTTKVKLGFEDGSFKIDANDNPTNLADDRSYYRQLVSSNGALSYVTFDNTYSKLTANGNREYSFTKPIFVALRNPSDGGVVIYSGSSAKNKKCILKEEIVISKSVIDEMFGSGEAVIEAGEWRFEVYKNDVIMAYKDGDTEIDKNAYFYDFGSLKRMYVKDDSYCDLFVPVKQGKNERFQTSLPQRKETVFATIRSSRKPKEKGQDTSYNDIKEEFYALLGDGNTSLFGITASLKNTDPEVAGSSKSHKLKMSNCFVDGDEPQGVDYPPEIPLSDLLMQVEAINESVRNGVTIDISGKLGSEKNEEKASFLKDVAKYGKIIMMFLVFVSIVYTGVLSIWSGQDAKHRAEIMVRLKNIGVGILIFAASVPAFAIVIRFANESFQSLADIADNYVGPTYYATETRYKTGFIVNFIGKIVDLLTLGINWLVDMVLSAGMSPGENVSLMQLIFNVYESDGTVSSLMPFKIDEWNFYMNAYKLLCSVSMAIMAIALVKLCGEMILSSGNYQKIAEAKESAKRIIFAIIAVVLAPYGFRILIKFFNYLTAMLPIDGDTISFDINFEAGGFVGAVSNMIFATLRLRIYILFFVRKIMIAFLLLASPVVLAIWSISKKFRSAKIWIGETLSNISVQFCYAMVFMVVMLITYEGQNPFITLIIVSLIPKFANFFSSSLEGLTTKWGGVNSDAVAGKITESIKDAGKGALGKFKSAGNMMQNSAKFFDPKGVSKAGRNVNNIGALMSGNVKGIRTKNSMMKNRTAVAKEKYDKDSKEFQDLQKQKDNILKNYPEGKEYYESLLRNEIPEGGYRDEGIYRTLNDYFKKKEEMNLSKNTYLGYKNLEDHAEEINKENVEEAFDNFRLNEVKENGEQNKIAHGVNNVLDGVKSPLKNAASAIAGTSLASRGIAGTLEQNAKRKTERELNKISASFKKAVNAKTAHNGDNDITNLMKRMTELKSRDSKDKKGNKTQSISKGTKENKDMIKLIIDTLNKDKSKSAITLNICQDMYDTMALRQINLTGSVDISMANAFNDAVTNFKQSGGSGGGINVTATIKESNASAKDSAKDSAQNSSNNKVSDKNQKVSKANGIDDIRNMQGAAFEAEEFKGAKTLGGDTDGVLNANFESTDNNAFNTKQDSNSESIFGSDKNDEREIFGENSESKKDNKSDDNGKKVSSKADDAPSKGTIKNVDMNVKQNEVSSGLDKTSSEEIREKQMEHIKEEVDDKTREYQREYEKTKEIESRQKELEEKLKKLSSLTTDDVLKERKKLEAEIEMQKQMLEKQNKLTSELHDKIDNLTGMHTDKKSFEETNFGSKAKDVNSEFRNNEGVNERVLDNFKDGRIVEQNIKEQSITRSSRGGKSDVKAINRNGSNPNKR